MKLLFLIGSLGLLFSCSSTPQPIVPDAEVVTVSREEADEDCKEIGPVTGSSTSAKASYEDSLLDLQKDASRRGANYVHLKGHSALGTTASGVAYICP